VDLNNTYANAPCDSQATSVAGIIAGNDAAKNYVGVAPRSQLGIYRVFPCGGTTTHELVLQALDQAHKDGMDILDFSIGFPSGSPNDTISIAVDELSKGGMIIAAALGNDQEYGMWLGYSPSSADYATGVGSMDNHKAFGLEITVGQLAPMQFSTFIFTNLY
jgi:hypothetical protein